MQRRLLAVVILLLVISLGTTFAIVYIDARATQENLRAISSEDISGVGISGRADIKNDSKPWIISLPGIGPVFLLGLALLGLSLSVRITSKKR